MPRFLYLIIAVPLFLLISVGRADGNDTLKLKSDVISALHGCKDRADVSNGGDVSCFLNVFNEYKMEDRESVYYVDISIKSTDIIKDSDHSIYGFIKSKPRFYGFFKEENSVLFTRFDSSNLSELHHVIINEDFKLLESSRKLFDEFNKKIRPERVDIIYRWLRDKDYRNVYLNQKEVALYLDYLEDALDYKIDLYYNGMNAALLLSLLTSHFNDLKGMVRSDLDFIESLEKSGELSHLAAKKVSDIISRDEGIFYFSSMLSFGYNYIEKQKKWASVVAEAGELPAFRKVIDNANTFGPLALYADKVKAKGWMSGLRVLADSEYFSDKYSGYIFRVDFDDGYQVVQSSGSIVRMESINGGPAIIIDFKKSPPPREGVGLFGRYLLLKKVVSYNTSLGVTRNAYLFDIAK